MFAQHAIFLSYDLKLSASSQHEIYQVKTWRRFPHSFVQCISSSVSREKWWFSWIFKPSSFRELDFRHRFIKLLSMQKVEMKMEMQENSCKFSFVHFGSFLFNLKWKGSEKLFAYIVKLPLDRMNVSKAFSPSQTSSLRCFSCSLNK